MPIVLLLGTGLNAHAHTDLTNTWNAISVPTNDPLKPGTYISEAFGIKATDRLIVGEFEFIADPGQNGESKGLRYAKKNGRTVKRFAADIVFGSPNWMGTASLLGKNSIQFFHVASTGVVCCANYQIVDIRNGKLRQIFRGDKLSWLNHPIRLYDFDDDGIFEISQQVSDFRYFAHMCGACSPSVSIVFKYDNARRRYIPAKLYTPDAFNYIEDTKLEIYGTNLNGELRTDYLSMQLSILLGYVYAGEREKGWSFFEKHYLGTDKMEQRRAINKQLNESQLYKAIYGHR